MDMYISINFLRLSKRNHEENEERILWKRAEKPSNLINESKLRLIIIGKKEEKIQYGKYRED